jgi:hypothetical protein
MPSVTKLVEIDAVVPWEEFRPVLERVWRKPEAARKSRAGRRPMDAVFGPLIRTMYGWLPRGKGFSVDAGVISAAAMYTASELQHGGCAP